MDGVAAGSTSGRLPPLKALWVKQDLTASALEVLLVEDDAGRQVDGDGAEEGGASNVGGDGSGQLDDDAHEERGDDLRQEEGAVQDGEVQPHAAPLAASLARLALLEGKVFRSVLPVERRFVVLDPPLLLCGGQVDGVPPRRHAVAAVRGSGFPRRQVDLQRDAATERLAPLSGQHWGAPTRTSFSLW